MKNLFLTILSTALISTVCLEAEIPGQKTAQAAEDAAAVVGAPSELHIMIVQNGFQLNWTLSPQDPGAVNGYEIVRADRFTGPYEPVGTVGKGISRFVDDTALPEIIYFYKIRAIAGKDYSAFSNTAAGERH